MLPNIFDKSGENIDIILPTRIGDSILSIPALMCIEQLNQRFNSNLNIKVLSRPFLAKLLSSLDLFKCKEMNFTEKAKSLLFQSDKAFFLETTNKYLGYFSKKSFGVTNPHKKFLKFSEPMPYLVFQNIKTVLPSDLVAFLLEQNKLSYYAASLFGICLDLEYSVEQIIDTFKFSPELIDLKNFPDMDKYLVFCMEAGYGRNEQVLRHWDPNNYFEISKRCFNNFGIKSAFIGVDSTVNLPSEAYITDFRGKLDLFELAGLLKSSIGYVGNDTGPLHLANLMKKRSVAPYFLKHSLVESCPNFPQFNTKIYMPKDIDEVYSKVECMLN